MIHSRRGFLQRSTGLLLAGLGSSFHSQFALAKAALSPVGRLPYTRELLERARLTDGKCPKPDRNLVESDLRRRSAVSGEYLPPVRWVETFDELYVHLAENHQAVCNPREGWFWKATFDEWFLLGGAEISKLRLSYRAMEQAQELFGLPVHREHFEAAAARIDERLQAPPRFSRESWKPGDQIDYASQIPDYIMTLMAQDASWAIWFIDIALREKMSEDCSLIQKSLIVIDAYEHGLMATWETADELICMSMPDRFETRPDQLDATAA